MKKIILLLVLLPSFLSAQDLVDYVNSFIGTGGHGHTFPGATAPFGFCQLSPDTRIDGSWDGCGGYHYSDSVIYGFSHTHLSGTGVSDYGDILLMPVTQEMELDEYQYKSSFSHNIESAVAGYYQVFLNEPKVNVELTTSRRCGFHKYAYPNNVATYVVLDLAHRDELLDSKMEQVDKYTIRGYRFSKAWATNQKVFYEIKFEQEIESMLYEPAKSGSKTSAVLTDKSPRALIKLKKGFSKPLNPAPNQIVQVKVGISGVDEKGAHNNLENEIPHWSFDKTKKWVQDEWNKELSKIQVADTTVLQGMMQSQTKKDKKIIFYSALYHCMIAPNIYSDVDNRYRGRDDKIHSTEGKFDYYTVFSLWDTYRALHPLLTIIDKKRTNDFIKTFIKQYEQGGRLPVWELSSNETNCMIGYHAASVIWDAYNKGIRDYDAEKAFEAMKSIATEDSEALKSYMKYGYVRAEDDHESVSKTLEYAYDDWCIAQMAKALGKKDDYKKFKKRSHNWINVYDPTTGFMRARKNSTLIEPFSPYLVDNNYTEANSWQYSFYVPHDVEQLIKVSGGVDKFEEKLDALFKASAETMGRTQSDITGLIGQYAHGNEPSHHIPYLYHLIGKKDKGNKIVSTVMDEFYTNSPDGYIGNEDCGQMSAWYVLNALNVYSFCPGAGNDFIAFNILDSKDYQFDSIHTRKYELLMVVSPEMRKGGAYSHASDTFYYWSNLSFDNNRYFSESLFNSNPFFVKANRLFNDSVKIEIQSNNLGAKVFYKLNSSIKMAELYTKPIVINSSTNIQFFTCHSKDIILIAPGVSTGGIFCDKPATPIQTAIFTKLPNDREVFLNCTYGKTYHAGGPMGLVDGIRGKKNWRAGDWQGYQGQDFEAVIAFDKVKKIGNVTASFLQDQRAWIFYPTKVEFAFSKDSINWVQDANSYTSVVKRDEDNVTIKEISMPKIESKITIDAKYIKVSAKNYGNLPDWHPGAGHPAYIFIDEIEIK